MPAELDAVVVGAGVAGLAAASELRARGLTVRVLESSDRVGGLIASERVGDYLVEHGADGLLGSDPQVLRTLDSLGLSEKIIRGGSAARCAFVATEPGLYPVPKGLFRFERRVALSMLLSPLLSLRAKLRLFLEPFIRRRRVDDESVAAFFERRLGGEVAARLVDPMLRGVFGAPSSELGICGVMPALARMERERGSLTLGLAMARPTNSGVGLVTLEGGMESLPRAMASRLDDAIVLGAKVVGLERRGDAWELQLASGESLRTPRVVLACPAAIAAGLVAPHSAAAASALSGVGTARVDVVSLGFEGLDAPLPDGTGFVVDRASGLSIAACTFVSGKWDGRAPTSGTLLRVTLDQANLDDAGLVALVRAELTKTLGITRAPSFTRIRRVDPGLPVYGVGHFARISQLRDVARVELPGIAFAGHTYDGIGIPRCLASGVQAAGELAGVAAAA